MNCPGDLNHVSFISPVDSFNNIEFPSRKCNFRLSGNIDRIKTTTLRLAFLNYYYFDCISDDKKNNNFLHFIQSNSIFLLCSLGWSVEPVSFYLCWAGDRKTIRAYPLTILATKESSSYPTFERTEFSSIS